MDDENEHVDDDDKDEDHDGNAHHALKTKLRPGDHECEHGWLYHPRPAGGGGAQPPSLQGEKSGMLPPLRTERGRGWAKPWPPRLSAATSPKGTPNSLWRLGHHQLR